MPDQVRGRGLGELARLFLKLGVLGFGGPAAHIAMMEDEVVHRRGWMDRRRFLDLVGATNLIPGPNSTEMAIHVGYVRAGWLGLVTAGVCFLTPAVAITTLFAWAYVRYGTLPAVEPLLFGIGPAVIAVVLVALWRLGEGALRGWRLIVVGSGVLVARLLGLGVLWALLAGGLLGAVWLLAPEPLGQGRFTGVVGFAGVFEAASDRLQAAAAGLAGAGAVSLTSLGLFFLKVGAVLYGSGYVLVAFLEGELVHELGWLTSKQLLDAIAIGQFTPGPVLSTAAFIGYLLAGLPGAGVSALAIFLPSFLFVAAIGPLVPRLRESSIAGAFLDAVNASALGIMAAVVVNLGQATLLTWPAWLIALAAGGAGIGLRVPAVWLVLGGALAGWLAHGALGI